MDRIVIFADHVIGYHISEYLHDNQIDFEILKIVSNQNNKSWWPRLEHNPKLSNNVFFFDTESTYSELLKTDIDYLLLLSWKHILPESIIKHVKKSIINLHYSLLPKHRGVYPINHAIESGDTETGITFHIVVNSIDAGPIIEQKKINIDPSDDASILLDKLDTIAYDTFKKIWKERNSWQEKFKPQIGKSCYNSHKKYLMNSKIDLESNFKGKDLINLIRSRNFGDKSLAYFIDEESGIKYFIHLKVIKSEE